MEEYLKTAVLEIIKENLLRKEEFMGYLNKFIADQVDLIKEEIVKTLKTEEFIKHIGDRVMQDLYSEISYPSTKLSLLVKDEVAEYIIKRIVAKEVDARMEKIK